MEEDEAMEEDIQCNGLFTQLLQEEHIVFDPVSGMHECSICGSHAGFNCVTMKNHFRKECKGSIMHLCPPCHEMKPFENQIHGELSFCLPEHVMEGMSENKCQNGCLWMV